jgi:hypothetical protein
MAKRQTLGAKSMEQGAWDIAIKANDKESDIANGGLFSERTQVV